MSIEYRINRKEDLKKAHKLHKRCGKFYCLSENGITLNTYTFNESVMRGV